MILLDINASKITLVDQMQLKCKSLKIWVGKVCDKKLVRKTINISFTSWMFWMWKILKNSDDFETVVIQWLENLRVTKIFTKQILNSARNQKTLNDLKSNLTVVNFQTCLRLVLWTKFQAAIMVCFTSKVFKKNKT